MWFAITTSRVADAEEPLESITFGSSTRQNNSQPIGYAILETVPLRFLFIVDNIYGDSQNMNLLRANYAPAGARLGFQKLRQAKSTWTDSALLSVSAELSRCAPRTSPPPMPVGTGRTKA